MWRRSRRSFRVRWRDHAKMPDSTILRAHMTSEQKQDQNNLVWIDMEMTGLTPDSDRIIEVALVVTDAHLNTVAEAPVLVVHQPEAVLNGMDDWNKSTHKKSGLIDKVKASTLADGDVEAQMIEFLKRYVPGKTSPMCGNSICQDRRFLARWMPKLEDYFHYRNLDVSTLKELAKRWKPEIMSGMKKHGKHEALADIYESIEELKYYREHFLNCPRPS
jgi:oligoribonuclease